MMPVATAGSLPITLADSKLYSKTQKSTLTK